MNKFGWLKQPEDNRDFQSTRYMLPHIVDVVLPQIFKQPVQVRIYNQLNLGSCTANSADACYEIADKERNPKTKFAPSRLFTYFNSRDDKFNDTGATIRDTFKALKNYGVCSEANCKYNINRFTKTPSKTAYKDGLKHTLLTYSVVSQDLNIIKKTIFSGAAVSFGFNVYESFETGNWDSTTGIMPIPKPHEQLLGGHANTIIGWDDTKKCFLLQNSWGEGWGLNGLFYMPYSFLLSKECSDFWCIESLK